MNIKCLFGKHDWEEAERLKESYVLNNLLEPEFRARAKAIIEDHEEWMKIPGDGFRIYLKKYVCLNKNCCAIKDEIQEFLDYFRKEGRKRIEQIKLELERKKQAEKKIKKCLKEKE